MNVKIKYRDNYIGMRFGNLVVIGYPVNRRGIRMAGAVCKCDCGNEVRVGSIGDLLYGKKTHCRVCSHKVRSDAAKKRWATNPPDYVKSRYGDLRYERLYSVWMSMRSRCNSKFGPYRDVSVCDEWQNDYMAFREWAYSHGYDDTAPRGQCTIDRINPYGNYEPSNCRFVDMATQQINKRKRWDSLDDETRKAIIAANVT